MRLQCVPDLLGPSLEDLFNFCNRKFSLKTVLLLADQLVCLICFEDFFSYAIFPQISRIKYIHSRNFIATSSLTTSSWASAKEVIKSILLILDSPRSSVTRRPTSTFLTGRTRTLPGLLVIHPGVEQARRDDLESLAYVLVYFLRAALPWQGLKAATKKQIYDRIMEKEMTTPTDPLPWVPQ